MLKTKQPKIIIGWNETVHLPDFDIWNLPAKIDTGAKTSSLHVQDISVLPQNKVRFTVVVDERKPNKNISLTEKIHRRSSVRTSHRDVQNRIFIRTSMKLGPVEDEIELNLSDRSDFRYRIILGRSAIAKHFLVDAQKGGLLSK